jgi:hypothetical protein
MPGPNVVYAVAGVVVACLAGWVAYVLAFAPRLIAAPPPPGPPDESRPAS